MAEDQKTWLFLAAQESPGAWYLRALRLRAAAHRLDWVDAPPTESEPVTSFFAEYYLLLGLSFEILLKGWISLIRLENGKTPSPPPFIHQLEELALLPECSAFAFSAAELETLRRLSPFIKWAGRYPFPRKASEMDYIYAQSSSREKENEMWDRVAEQLCNRAWIMKGGPESMGGKCLYFSRPKAQTPPSGG